VTPVSIVVARARSGVIGRDGGLPWRLPGDMRHFRELTTGHAVIMGRRTWESIPERFRPLPGRRNIVLTRRAGYAAPGAEVLSDLPTAIAACDGDAFVIGGGQVYGEALALATRAVVTEIEADVEGDAFFPPLDPAEWALADEGERMVEDGLPYVIRTYERR
jgi:dihydrofolate reductase